MSRGQPLDEKIRRVRGLSLRQGTPQIARECKTPFCSNRSAIGQDKCRECSGSGVLDLPPPPPRITHETKQYQRAREYKCPCGGEFDEWEQCGDREGESLVCPFCGAEKYAHRGEKA